MKPVLTGDTAPQFRHRGQNGDLMPFWAGTVRVTPAYPDAEVVQAGRAFEVVGSLIVIGRGILTSRKSTKLNGWVAALSRTVEHPNASSRTTRVWLGA